MLITEILVIHIFATLVLACANAASLGTTILARRTDSPVRLLRLLRLHELFAAKILVAAAAVVLVTGGWLTYQSGVSPLAPWILGTAILFVASALVGILFLLPEERRAVAEAQRLVAAGASRPSDTLVRHTASPAIIACEWGEQVLMVSMFVLMLVKPT